MANKNTITSILMFCVSVVLFVIFSLTTFFGGQEIGGSIYLVYIFFVVALAFLDKKISSNYVRLYRYTIYIEDAFNILAAASMIYYNIYRPLMIAILCVLCVCFLVDLISQNRLQHRRVASIIVGLINCGFMCMMFPFFFDFNVGQSFVIVGLTLASVILILKVILALVPVGISAEPEAEKKSNESEEIEKDLRNNSDEPME